MSGFTGPDSGPGAAGKWTDAATGEHGDLLDLIGLNRNLPGLGEAMDEARCFLALPRPPIPSPTHLGHAPPQQADPPKPRAACFVPAAPFPARRPRPICAPAASPARLDWPALRYHPSVYYRETDDAPLESWPALLAAVTDLDGTITGIQRTWLDPRRPDQGAACRSAPRPRPSARQRRALRQGRATSSPPAKASRPCSRSNRCCPHCR